MTKDEALRLAQRALSNKNASTKRIYEALAAIQTALAQPAQGPDELTIAYMSGLYDGKKKRPWVGLTNEEITKIVGPYGDVPVKGYTRKLFDQIEAALRSKNT